MLLRCIAVESATVPSMRLSSLLKDPVAASHTAFIVSPSRLADPFPAAAALAQVERSIAQCSADTEKLERLAHGLSPRIPKWQKGSCVFAPELPLAATLLFLFSLQPRAQCEHFPLGIVAVFGGL